MEIKVNGEPKSITDDRLSIADILKRFDVEMPDMVSVQLNGIFLERRKFATTVINNNDEIDFLYFMGGGR